MGWIAAAVQVAREIVGLPRPLVLDLAPTAVFDTAPRPIDQVLASMKNGDLSKVSRSQALSIAAVQRGRNELCSISTLPLRLYQGTSVVDSPLFRQFDPDVPNVVHMAMTIEDLAMESVAWWEVTGQDFDRYPVSVRRIDPTCVTLRPPGKSGQGQNPGGVYYDNGKYVWIDRQNGRGPQPVASELMIRFDSPNPGVLSVSARTIRRALDLDRCVGMYAANPALREYFTDADSADVDGMNEDEIDAFLAEYGAMRNVRPFGWIPSTVKRADVSAPSPRDLTLVDLQRQVTLELANGLGVDPEDLGVSTTSRTYFNSVDKKQDKINRTYKPFMCAITDRLGMGDVTRRGYAPGFDLTEYLTPDPITQATYWKALLDMGVTDKDEIRGWAKLPGPAPAAAPAALPAAPATSSRFDAAGPAMTFHATDFTAPPAAPTVDAAARTITGLAVPYNATAQKYGLSYRFRPGSLEYSDPSRMAHLKDHMTPVGFHRSIKDSAAGPVVALAVLDGPEGSPAKMERDQLLYDAEHGLYSGLSIGVDFNMDPEAGDVEFNADDNVYEVIRATWRETSTTYMPAFDDARVTKVAASSTGGSPMDPCVHCGKFHAPNIACATFAAQTRQAAPPAAPAPDLNAQFAAFLAAQPPAALPAAPAVEAPTPVNPHHNVAVVTEPLPYRYDRRGNLGRGSHDFSSDIGVAYNPNYQGADSREAADKRITGWLAYAFGDVDGAKHLGRMDLPGSAQQQFAAISPANVVNLNYPQNHPEMYVDQLDYLYPMYQEFNKGTLDTVTPFVLPKFNASSGLVADHVSGTEPTPGAFTATSQTITPTPLSGKVEITREVFDQGGNPQASGLIWRQMVRGWYEGIEAAIQAFFVANAASIPDVALGTAVTDAAMDSSLATMIANLQYVRGGDRYRKIFTQVDLYQKLINAKDTTNRPLYPPIGAMNAAGGSGPDASWINVRGKMFVPEWATAATGAVAASSWMMDPDVVGVWLSTPQRIDLQWRVAWVDMGIWGYKALAVTDYSRTRELIYDPV